MFLLSWRETKVVFKLVTTTTHFDTYWVEEKQKLYLNLTSKGITEAISGLKRNKSCI